MVKNIAIIGSSGALGSAFVDKLLILYPNAVLHAFSQRGPKNPSSKVRYHSINYQLESSIAEAASMAAMDDLLDIVIVAIGILHDQDVTPEKSLQSLSADNFRRVFEINTIAPALIAKHFCTKLRKEGASWFAVLSARVGSISDNRLGGWYSYRASKAALNMIIKNTAIEIGRKNPKAIVVGLHPGTVDSNLSKPFQANVPSNQLFTAEFSATKLLEVLAKLTPEESGRCFAWDGMEIEP